MTKAEAKKTTLPIVRRWEFQLQFPDCRIEEEPGIFSLLFKLSGHIVPRLVQMSMWIALVLLTTFKAWVMAALIIFFSCIELVKFTQSYLDGERRLGHLKPTNPWPRR